MFNLCALVIDQKEHCSVEEKVFSSDNVNKH